MRENIYIFLLCKQYAHWEVREWDVYVCGSVCFMTLDRIRKDICSYEGDFLRIYFCFLFFFGIKIEWHTKMFTSTQSWKHQNVQISLEATIMSTISFFFCLFIFLYQREDTTFLSCKGKESQTFFSCLQSKIFSSEFFPFFSPLSTKDLQMEKLWRVIILYILMLLKVSQQLTL